MQIPILQAPALPVRSLAGIDHDIGELAIYGEAVPVSGLSAFPQLSDLWLSKASVEICRQIGETASLRQLIVHDWRASDLTPIADLTELRSLAIAGSPKLKSLSGIERLTSLHSLILFDCCGYSSIEPLCCLTGLNTLCLEGGFSKPLKLETLEPIGHLTNLQQLRLASLRTADKRLRSLHTLTQLREVFICKAFPKSEFWDLATALPLARGQFLDTHRSE